MHCPYEEPSKKCYVEKHCRRARDDLILSVEDSYVSPSTSQDFSCPQSLSEKRPSLSLRDQSINHSTCIYLF